MLPKLNVLRLYALRTQFILARSLFAGSTSFCTHRLWAARHRYGCATMHSNTGRSTNHHLVTLYCVYVLCMQTIVTLAVPAGFLPLKGQGNTLSAPTPQSLYYFCFFFCFWTPLPHWIKQMNLFFFPRCCSAFKSYQTVPCRDMHITHISMSTDAEQKIHV